VLSDNPNRANADIKSTVNKRQAKIAEQGSVLFMYDRKGKVEVSAEVDEEKLLDAAIEADIDDYLLEGGDEEGTSVVYVEPTNSKAPIECNDEDFEKNMAIIEALEELDDVDSVEHNMSN
jgi:transcriptional/translational regulatory protein YebC/TACO1